MVVHGDDFIVAGCGDDLDWLSQKLNEKLELVQEANLGPGYDSEATVLNCCVIYNDSPQSSPRGAKPSTPLDHEELTQHDWHFWKQTDLTLHSPARNAARAVGKATRADLRRLKRIGRHLLRTPRAVWKFPLQTQERAS